MKKGFKKEDTNSRVLFFDCYQTLIDINIDKERQEIDKKNGWERFISLLDRRHGIYVSYSVFMSLLDRRTNDSYEGKDEAIYHHDISTIILEVCEKDLKVKLQNKQILDLIDEYRKISRGFIRLYPKVEKTLAQLSEKYSLSIASYTQSTYTRNELKELKIEKYFTQFIYSSDVGFRKTSEEFYKKCLEIVGKKPEECVMIGDNFFEDVIIPSKLGIKTVWIKNPKTVSEYPDLSVSKVTSVIDLREFNKLPDVVGEIFGKLS